LPNDKNIGPNSRLGKKGEEKKRKKDHNIEKVVVRENLGIPQRGGS